MICSVCGKVSEKNRLPRTWKRFRMMLYCEQCWHAQFVLRAVVIPVVSPLDASWEELYRELNRMFALTTNATNWMIHELSKRDTRRTPGVEKMPPMGHIYLYPEARKLFEDLPPQSLAALEQSVQRKYRARRFETIWKSAAQFPVARYPQPFPVHNQSWAPRVLNDTPAISVRIGPRRFELRLKGTERYRRQRRAFDLMARGEALYGQLDLYSRDTDLFAKMVAWLPKMAAMERTGVLYASTASDALLIVANQKDETLWRYNADQVRRVAKEHRAQLARWAEDSKAEERPVPSFSERRQRSAIGYQRQMKTAADQAARSLVNYCGRRKFLALELNSSDVSYSEWFPWHYLKSRIETLCAERSIEFRASTGMKKKTG